MKNSPFSSGFSMKTPGLLALKSALSSYLPLGLRSCSLRHYRKNTTRSTLVSLALLALSCLPSHAQAQGTGNGLKANYRHGTDAAKSSIIFTRTDAKIDFNWGLGSPASSVPADQFSINWEGEIQPRYTGEYTFYGTSDDGNVVIINGQTIVYDPNPHAARTATGKITLEAGKRYPIKVYFYEATGQASMKLEWSSANQPREVVPTSQLYSAAAVSAPISGTTNFCANEGAFCSFSGTQQVRYGANGQYVTKTLTNGTACTNAIFGDPIVGVAKTCEVLASVSAPAITPKPAPTETPTPTATPTPTPTPTPTAVVSAGDQANQTFQAAVNFDYEGENGVPYTGGPSIGYPEGVPNGYSWKFGGGGLDNVANGIKGRGPQSALSAYNQVYKHRPGDEPHPNARVETENMVVKYHSISQNKWITVISQPTTGAAFSEDFVNNQATGADAQTLPNGNISLRSGIGNASGEAGGTTGRVTDDGPVGFNYHGFGNRVALPWADADAVLIYQRMRCTGADCSFNPYIAQIGIDSWATTTSNYDNFATHGGVSGGRFKPVLSQWQYFTNFVGPASLKNSVPSP